MENGTSSSVEVAETAPTVSMAEGVAKKPSSSVEVAEAAPTVSMVERVQEIQGPSSIVDGSAAARAFAL